MVIYSPEHLRTAEACCAFRRTLYNVGISWETEFINISETEFPVLCYDNNVPAGLVRSTRSLSSLNR